MTCVGALQSGARCLVVGCSAAACFCLVGLVTPGLAWRSYEEYVPLERRRQMDEAQRLARLANKPRSDSSASRQRVFPCEQRACVYCCRALWKGLLSAAWPAAHLRSLPCG